MPNWLSMAKREYFLKLFVSQVFKNVNLVCLAFFLSIFISNSDNFNRRKYKESDPMPK